jgi:uncharacterized cupin superfamily protein
MACVEIRKLSEQELEKLGIDSWPQWECQPSVFDWEYSDTEHCYVHEGKVTVETPEGSFNIKAGDFVTFEKNLKCKWNVQEAVRKVYKFGQL